MENLFFAWREFKRGKTGKHEVQKFGLNLENNLFDLHQVLKEKKYIHGDYVSFYVSDPKLRHIHKASVRDRVLHQAIFRILYPIFDKKFIFDSYSCRKNKGTHKGIFRLESFCRKASRKYCRTIYALKCDIRKFFASIDQNILLDLIKAEIKDNNAIWLIERIVESFESIAGRGLPLGNVTSQLFANIYLNELDKFIKCGLNIKYYLRYCDDFIILSNDKNYLLQVLSQIDNFLRDKLELFLHPDKILIRKLVQGIDFLGYVVLPYYKVLRTKTKRRILKKIKYKRRQLNKGWITSGDFDRSLQSYLGLLVHGKNYKIQKKLLGIAE